jgi:hypothetical protein
MKRFLPVILKFLIMGLSLTVSKTALADVRVNASVLDGGNSLRFGRVDIPTATTKDVRLHITSTDNTQYQVFQRLVDPLMNERGETLPRSVLLTASRSGSNGSGTIYIQGSERVSYSDQLVYTSSQDGLSDAFTLVYQVSAEDMTASGNFLGKLMYTVRPVGSGSQDQTFVDIFVEASGELKIDVKTSSGVNRIALSSEGETQSNGYVRFDLQESREPLKLYQEMVSPMVNELNQDLDLEAIDVGVEANNAGEVAVVSTQTFDPRKTFLYTFSASSDFAQVQFMLNRMALDQAKAGQYRGQMRYWLENDRGVVKEWNVDLDVNIAPVFEIQVKYPSEGMKFSNVLPNTPEEMREVFVEVKTNTGKPYWVSQSATGGLVNEKGEAIEADFFSMKQELVTQEAFGKVAASEFEPVKQGDTALFYSDASGKPAQFKVLYKLTPYQKMQAGNYKVGIVYSLGEL